MKDNIATTEHLIRRLQAGDEKPLSELMKRYNPRILPMILSESRNYQDAEDILSKTWQAVWENISGLRDVSSFGGWLRKIAYNQCRRYYNNAYYSQGERPFYLSTVAHAHLSWGSHQHDEDDPDDTTFWDVVDTWLELVPGYEQVKTTVGWVQHQMYTESTPYYTTSDIGGGFYRCSCGVSYSYYDSHSH